MKRILTSALMAAITASLALAISGCGGETVGIVDAKSQNGGASIKVGIVLSTGGLGDKNFNDMAYSGLLRAQKDFGIEFDYIEPKSVSDFIPDHRMYAESEEYDLIIGMAQDQAEAVKEIAESFPDQKITHIDANTEAPNVSSIFTKWQEQTFLTGVIAGLGTREDRLDNANDDHVVGVILGVDAPNLQQGVVGFEAGVRYVNPDCEVMRATVGSFSDPGKGKEIALSMYNRGADFVQHIAGASGLGVFNAAKEVGRYAFGVGGNQNDNEPDYIPATALRNVDEMVYNEIKALVQGTWTPGVHISGIKEGTVGYTTEKSNIKLPDDMIEIVEEIKQKIVSGELVPCSEDSELQTWLSENQYQD